jgi:hypothetical protein
VIALTFILLSAYLVLLRRLNRGSSVFTPMGMHAAFFTGGIALPALYVCVMDPWCEAGVKSFFVGRDLLWALDLALLFLGLGAVAAALLAADAPRRCAAVRDDVPRSRTYGIVAGAILLTLFFFYKNADLYRDLFRNLLTSTDVFDLIQDTRIDALYGSTYAVQGLTRVLPIVIVLLACKWYARADRSAGGLALTLLAIDFACLSVIGIRGTQICVLMQLAMVHNYFAPFSGRRVLLYAGGIGALLVTTTALKFGFGFSANRILFLEVLGHAANRVSLGAIHLQYVLSLFPRELAHRNGMTYVQDLVSLIPSPIKRAILPPAYWVDFNGYLYQRLFAHDGGTTTETILGELYANFGYAGIGLGCFVYGFVLQAWSTRFARRAWRTTSAIGISICLAFYLAQSTIEGVGETFFVTALWVVILYVVLFPGRALLRLALQPANTP